MHLRSAPRCTPVRISRGKPCGIWLANQAGMYAHRSGRVSLVGAGPGDPELLTLKAARRIAEADAILIDALVDRRVLEHARPDARVIEVGKRGGCRSTPQQFIERLMIRLACTGAKV